VAFIKGALVGWAVGHAFRTALEGLRLAEPLFRTSPGLALIIYSIAALADPIRIVVGGCIGVMRAK
jgi:hypothetical protein